MIKIYHQTDTRLGYLYFSGGAGNFKNCMHSFKDKYALKSFLTGVKIDSFKFDLEAFVQVFNKHEECNTHLEKTSLATIEKFLKWINSQDFPIEKIKVQFNKLKEEFTTIIKASSESKDDLFMLYKSMKEI